MKKHLFWKIAGYTAAAGVLVVGGVVVAKRVLSGQARTSAPSRASQPLSARATTFAPLPAGSTSTQQQIASDIALASQGVSLISDVTSLFSGNGAGDVAAVPDVAMPDPSNAFF